MPSRSPRSARRCGEGSSRTALAERYGSFGGGGTADVAVDTTAWTVLGALATVLCTVETADCTGPPDPEPGFVDPFSLPEPELEESVDVDWGGDVELVVCGGAEPDEDGV